MWRRLDRLLAGFEEAVITLGMGLGTLLLFANVVARYVFDTGFVWVLEAVQYIFAWVVLIGAAHGVKAGIHLGVDILVRHFSRPVRRILALIALGVSLGFAVPVLWLSVEYTWRIYQWGDLSLDLQIPQWIPYLAIPLGMALMTLHLLEVGVQIWRDERLQVGRAEHEQVASEAKAP